MYHSIVPNLLKINNNDTWTTSTSIEVVLVSLVLTLNTFGLTLATLSYLCFINNFEQLFAFWH